MTKKVKENSVFHKVRELYERKYDIDAIAKKLNIPLRLARQYYKECGDGMVRF